MAKAIMIQGTSSGVGKTILTTALCRIFTRDGYKTAPFKAQNMTANTALTGSGEEIAVSQIIQAKAAGVQPEASMNPIVLKPSPDGCGVQLVLNGSPCGAADAYKLKGKGKELLRMVMEAYGRLAQRYDVIVIEGAGSPVELNLNADDIVNMGLAKGVCAPVLLVADIDRGGAFASLYGTLGLLDQAERALVKATILNRFRGELAYFYDGKAILEKITGIPVAGVVPHISLALPEEDDLYSAQAAPPDSDYTPQFDVIEGAVRQALDMELVYKIL